MKLKTLAIAVLALAGLAAIAHFATRPAAPAAADPRVGQPLLPAATAAAADRLTVAENGRTVTLTRGADHRWTVGSYHDFPADFAKLSRFIRELTDAKIDRFVTASPERIARLDFTDTTIALAGSDGEPTWSVTLGKSAENGGRFLRFGDGERVYLARLNTYLDTTAKNWADSALVDLKPADIARVELGFSDDEAPVVAARNDTTAPFAAEQSPEDQRLKSDRITSLLTTLTGLRFIDTAPYDSADAVDARAHARTIKLTTFDGQTVTLTLGRRPEQDAPAPEPADANDQNDDSAPSKIVSADSDSSPNPESKIPPGPVFAHITTTRPDAWTNAVGETLAFKISDYPFTGLPQSRAELFEAAPSPPADEPAAP